MATEAIDWAGAGTVGGWALAGVTAAVIVTAAIAGRLRRRRSPQSKTSRGGRAPAALAALAALLASYMSIQAQWEFFDHSLEIHDPWQRAAGVAVLDLIGIAAALLAREIRTSRPGSFPVASLIVWAVALLLGYLGSTEAATGPGQVARWAFPLGAAIMWDQVIHRDVQAASGWDRARVATVTGRAVAGIVRAATTIVRSVTRTLARWGLLHPADEDITTIRRNRWHRQLISRAATAADALREVEAVADLPATDKRRRRATAAYGRTVAPFRASIVAGQQLGVITDSGDLDQILWEAAVVIRAEDALTQATGRSPWSPDQPTGTPTDRPAVIDGEVVDRPTDRSTGLQRPTDRPVEYRPTNHRPTNHRPTGHRPGRPEHRPTGHRPSTLTDRPPNRPTDRPLLGDGPQSRPRTTSWRRWP